ncbi:PaaI family thioesterase [Lactococcus allomyrinae]|uniref:PaaI family thioesterase n=1 Tax=Lactococcus allomyrinae TaxID=2419773 RepID=A0A387BFY3_9LACT|nr:PaaI family thioesterase [Lactococcus allomyrinae]AYF99896.1 PaaI family thioesterase [Lactococcus allomyrinae]
MNMIEQLNISPVKLLTDKSENFGQPADRFVSQMKLNDFHAQPQGFLNGGATLAFCEITSGMASNQLLTDGFFAVGQTVNANHLQPKKAEGIVNAYGQLLRKGRHTHVWEIRVTDESEQLIAQVTVVNAIVPKK